MQLPLYFISDIHLNLNRNPGEVKRQEHLFSFFRHIGKTGGTLFIVGDLFDFYFEYPDVIPKTYFEFYRQLATLKDRGIELHYLLGNHDYWGMKFIRSILMDKVYPRDTIIRSGDSKIYLTHGDGILSWDYSYRVLKTVLQHPWFIAFYRWIHPTVGYAFARLIANRQKNYPHSEDYNSKVRTEMTAFAARRIQEGADAVITGHYHQAVEIGVAKGKLIILGDWIRLFTYAIFDGHELQLRSWDSHA
ncbi:MAG: UDP-2,3-diacylglucosamine diphosphatase [Fidelibacterota bacterium]